VSAPITFITFYYARRQRREGVRSVKFWTWADPVNAVANHNSDSSEFG